MMDSILPRTPYQGVVQIFNYNRPFYVCTAAAAFPAILTSFYATPALRILILFSTGIAVFWICSSLLVSHCVYDRAGLYKLCWLPRCLARTPERWINIHAGLDEMSPILRCTFPGSEGQVIDIYDPRRMTEPSIKRARRMAGVSYAATDLYHLPAGDDEFDAVFLIFAAHELRHHKDRMQLFRETARVLRGEGELLLVEHLRDWANFLAFGPGFLHFFSKRTWASAANSAGFQIKRQSTVTPFVHVFLLQKSQ